MARKVNLIQLKANSNSRIDELTKRIADAEAAKYDYLLIRWMCAMIAVELHGIWERYVEDRLATGLNHNPSFFVADQGLTGVTSVSTGLAHFVIRGGQKYFNFRSMGDLIGRSDRFLGKPNNPFRNIPRPDCNYVDALAAVRNRVVHGSDASIAAYKAALGSVYKIASAPGPDEFLKAIASPLRRGLWRAGLIGRLSLVADAERDQERRNWEQAERLLDPFRVAADGKRCSDLALTARLPGDRLYWARQSSSS